MLCCLFDRRSGMVASHRYGHSIDGWKIVVRCKGYESHLNQCEPQLLYTTAMRDVFISCNNTGM